MRLFKNLVIVFILGALSSNIPIIGAIVFAWPSILIATMLVGMVFRKELG